GAVPQSLSSPLNQNKGAVPQSLSSPFSPSIGVVPQSLRSPLNQNIGASSEDLSSPLIQKTGAGYQGQSSSLVQSIGFRPQSLSSSLIQNTGVVPQSLSSPLVQNTGASPQGFSLLSIQNSGAVPESLSSPLIQNTGTIPQSFRSPLIQNTGGQVLSSPLIQNTGARPQSLDSSLIQNTDTGPQALSSALIQNTGARLQGPSVSLIQNAGVVPESQSSLLIQNTGQLYCSVSEVYKYCGGCDQYCNIEQVFCTADCRPGCYCQDGYVRLFQGGTCIPIKTCPAPQGSDFSVVENTGYQCNENEVFQQCGVGWECEDFCGRGPNDCAYCQTGCYCKAGYIRSGPEYDAVCIPEDQCPDQVVELSPIEEDAYQCGENEVFQQCGVGWECEDYCGRGSNACAYCQPGCYCSTGYTRSSPEYDATCIPANQCSRIKEIGPSGIQEAGQSFGGWSGIQGSNSGYHCGENEIFDNCGVGIECEDFCGRGPNACAYCQPGCYCRPGYVRSRPEYDAGCIPENQCSSVNGIDSSFVEYPGPGALDTSAFFSQDAQGPGSRIKEIGPSGIQEAGQSFGGWSGIQGSNSGPGALDTSAFFSQDAQGPGYCRQDEVFDIAEDYC
ncbi:unnamed protein product, partial [Larinioides sclopetarius]